MDHLQIAADVIIFANEVLGKPGPIILDTQIHYHNSSFEILQAHPGGNLPNDLINIGRAGEVISLGDIYNALNTSETRADFEAEFKSGRTYIFEGFGRDAANKYHINWGS